MEPKTMKVLEISPCLRHVRDFSAELVLVLVLATEERAN